MSDKKIFSRRGFIQSIFSIIGGTTAFAVTSTDFQAEQIIDTSSKAQPQPKAKGYQRTEHVNTYYALADL